MMRPDAKVEKVYLYPKPVDFRKSIDGLTALVELDIKVAVFDPVLFVFLNKTRNRVKVLYWERNGFCLWLKRLEAERFKTSPDVTDEAIVLATEKLQHRVAVDTVIDIAAVPAIRVQGQAVAKGFTQKAKVARAEDHVVDVVHHGDFLAGVQVVQALHAFLRAKKKGYW